jgi:hypothetical protein
MPRVHCGLTPRVRTKRLKTTDGLSANLMGQTWPTEFWPRPVDRELVRALAEARRERQLDKELFAQIQPCGPEGLVPRSR